LRQPAANPRFIPLSQAKTPKKQLRTMKKLITLVSTMAVMSALLVGCGGGTTEKKMTQQTTMVWADSTTCPITGKKFPQGTADTPGTAGELYSFEKDGVKYEFSAFDGKAIEEFEKNRAKYEQKIIDGSEPY
jgi:uncharacterized protein YcfL